MNHSGHSIILRPDLDLKEYEALDFVYKNSNHLQRLREILGFLTPTNYRGTGRSHFSGSPFWIDSNGILSSWPDSNVDDYDNLEARKLFALIEDKNTPINTCDDLCFFSLQEMRQVYEVIKNRSDYEIVEIQENEEKTTNNTLGFDVGYMGGDFFSAIADTAIKPIWHPPDFNDMDEIIEHLKKLNKYCLFNSFNEARAYRQLYLSKKWAEKETHDGQLAIIQIRTT
jgi:hypothetical protein